MGFIFCAIGLARCAGRFMATVAALAAGTAARVDYDCRRLYGPGAYALSGIAPDRGIFRSRAGIRVVDRGFLVSLARRPKHFGKNPARRLVHGLYGALAVTGSRSTARSSWR